jgi:hypothetical protein
MYKSDPKNVHTYTHPFRGVYECIWICIFSCINNKFTFFYFLEYNLFNQPTQQITLWRFINNWVGWFNHEELNLTRVLSHEKKTGAVLPQHFLMILQCGVMV